MNQYIYRYVDKPEWIMGYVDVTDSCWLWLGGKDKDGYGLFNLQKNRPVRVHRYFYEILKDCIPEGLVTDHLCRVRNCVNPDHLEIVTPRENALRGIGPSAINAKKTHCSNGHELPENRKCIACARENLKRYQMKNRELLRVKAREAYRIKNQIPENKWRTQ